MKRLTKNIIALSIVCTAFLSIAWVLITAQYGEYGRFNLHHAVDKYVKDNGGAWPSCWEDIEPYHKDILFPTNSTIVVRQFWQVAWNVKESNSLKASSIDGLEEYGDYTPVIYNPEKVTDPTDVKNWWASPYRVNWQTQ